VSVQSHNTTLIARLISGLFLFGLLTTPLWATDRSEYEVKAAFLLNFTHFVEWPGPPSVTPFSICVIGPDPFGPVLDKIVGAHTVNGRPMVIKRFARTVTEGSCQIAFMGEVERNALLKLLPVLESGHALTVGDSVDFAKRYGVIGFVVENERVSLAINPARASRSGLKINSQLMRVATIVSEGSRAPE
jgi:hypothetical protein